MKAQNLKENSDPIFDAQLVEHMIHACHLFVHNKLTLDHFEIRIIGPRRQQAVSNVLDERLRYELFALQLDFFTWKGGRDDLIYDRAATIVALVSNATQQ
jgi:stress-induced morphogen